MLAVAFRMDGEELAVSTLDAQITLWNPTSAVQTGSIEGRHDLGYTRKEMDKITAKKSAGGKYVELHVHTAKSPVYVIVCESFRAYLIFLIVCPSIRQ